MSNFTDFARGELERAKLFDDDSVYGGALGPAVMRMIEVFAEEEHSGASASMAVSIFTRLAGFKPLTPLTGDDDEWTEVGTQNGGPLYQNKRCSHVFKDPNGAYDLYGVAFRDGAGAIFTNFSSRVPVTFPYSPKTIYKDAPANES